MKKNVVRRQYSPPQAKDLSGFGVTGQGPLGACVAGNLPLGSCVAGPAHPTTDCLPGSGGDSSYCEFGGYHTRPSCNFGGSAATICFSGAHQSG
jgi:hypothetical protein